MNIKMIEGLKNVEKWIIKEVNRQGKDKVGRLRMRGDIMNKPMYFITKYYDCEQDLEDIPGLEIGYGTFYDKDEAIKFCTDRGTRKESSPGDKYIASFDKCKEYGDPCELRIYEINRGVKNDI